MILLPSRTVLVRLVVTTTITQKILSFETENMTATVIVIVTVLVVATLMILTTRLRPLRLMGLTVRRNGIITDGERRK